MVELSFESGTVVVRGLPAPLAAGIGCLLWDRRCRVHRARAADLSRLRAELRLRHIESRESLAAPPPLAEWAPPSLRPYQQAALVSWEAAEQRGLVVLPTGAGKTRLALAALAACGVSALILVPTRVLLHQWLGELALHYRGAVGQLGDGEQRVEAITVATFEAGFRNMQRFGDRFALLVVDEAHHFGAGVRDEALLMSVADKRLGLTATPPDGPQRARLEGLVGPVVFTLSIGDLTGQFLADYDLAVLRLRFSDAERTRYEAAVHAFRQVHEPFRRIAPHGTWQDFVRAASRTPEGQCALRAFRASRELVQYPAAKQRAVMELLARHRGARLLVFTADNPTAYRIAREALIMPITCDIGRAERDTALADFRAGRLTALVSARVLNEGLDVPDAEVAIVVGGMHGVREHVQRVGRLLRPRPGKRALIYELVVADTHEERVALTRRRALASAS
jgi:superfamily II DNA or RNA helicase